MRINKHYEMYTPRQVSFHKIYKKRNILIMKISNSPGYRFNAHTQYIYLLHIIYQRKTSKN